jgi:hypothetical protein
MKYNHAFDIAFSVVSERPDTRRCHRRHDGRLIKRVIQAYDSGELLRPLAHHLNYAEEVK